MTAPILLALTILMAHPSFANEGSWSAPLEMAQEKLKIPPSCSGKSGEDLVECACKAQGTHGEALIECIHVHGKDRGSKLDVKLTPNPGFIPWESLNESFTLGGKTGSFLLVVEYGPGWQTFLLQLYAIALAKGYDDRVKNFIVAMKQPVLGRQVPVVDKSDAAKAQFCDIVTRVSQKANMDLGIPAFGSGKKAEFIPANDVKEFGDLIRSKSEQAAATAATRKPTYPCD